MRVFKTTRTDATGEAKPTMPKPTKPPGKPVPPTDPPVLPAPPYAGREATPDTLASLLSATSPVLPGETLWLTQGTYSGVWNSLINGTSALPILVRVIPGHKVVFDGAIQASGSYTWFWGVEVIQTVKLIDPIISGVELRGIGNKLINAFVHDCCQGVGTWSMAEQEVYGCIISHNGWLATDGTKHGHGIYAQNDLGEKWIRDNILLDGLAYGIHAYGQQGQLKHLRFIGNWSYNNTRTNFHLGGYLPIEDARIQENILYQSAHTTLCTFGYSAKGNFGLDCQNNAFLNGKTQITNWNRDIINRDNLHVTTGDVMTYNPEVLTDPPTYPTADWDANVYMCNKIGGSFATDGSVLPWMTFEQWKSLTGYDANSSYGMISPADLTLVKVRPNAYEQGRAHVAAYLRGGNSASVSINLNGILTDGQAYSIYRVPDLTTPVITGIHALGQLTGIPLGDAEFSTYLVRGK